MIRAALISLFLTSATVVSAQNWELRKEEDGILLYTRENGTPYKTIQTVTVINTSMAETVTLIMNVDRFPEWIYKCESARVLEKRSEDELIHYQVNSVPFVKDRDMVIQLTKTEDETGDITITQKALPEFMPQEDDLVRITRFDGIWHLKSVESGIEVKYTVDADPGGDLPKRLVNKGMIDGPFETAYNMKRILEQKIVAKKRGRR